MGEHTSKQEVGAEWKAQPDLLLGFERCKSSTHVEDCMYSKATKHVFSVLLNSLGDWNGERINLSFLICALSRKLLCQPKGCLCNTTADLVDIFEMALLTGTAGLPRIAGSLP